MVRLRPGVRVLFVLSVLLGALSPGLAHAALPDATAYSWGASTNGTLGTGIVNGLQSTPTALPTLGGISTGVAAGWYHGLALAGGTVYAWGENKYGQVGTATVSPYYYTTPQLVAGLSNIRAIAAGGHHSLALMDDGTVWSWGDNSMGQLGHPSTKCSSVSGVGLCTVTPQPVLSKPGVALAGVVAIAAGYDFSVALRNDGTVWVWGSNEYGQFADGTASMGWSTSYVPIQATIAAGQPLTGVTAIAAGAEHVLALQAPNSSSTVPRVYGWGQPAGVIGQLRPPCSQVYSAAPCIERAQAVLGTAGLSGIAAGSDRSFAVANGQVYAWGWGLGGELGDGSMAIRTTPVLLSSISGVQSIAAGLFHTLALMNDGTVRGWGDPGALGLSCPTSPCTTPQVIPGLSGIYGISAGMGFNLAVTGMTLPTICLCEGLPIVRRPPGWLPPRRP